MRVLEWLTVAAVLGCALEACKSGSTPLKCNYTNPATLATSTWPKFRHDLQNTGNVCNGQSTSTPCEVSISTNPAPAWIFPADGTRRGAFAASPVIDDPGINPDNQMVYIGSSDGTLYALCIGTNPTCNPGSQNPVFAFGIPSAITSTAVIGVRNSQDAIFVGSNADLYALDATGLTQGGGSWPFEFSGFISASPTLYADGTVYVGAQSGTFFGACPNGLSRWGVSVNAVQSSAAIDTNGTVYFGAADGQLRAITFNGAFSWTFSASGPILTAPVVEVDNTMTPPATVAIYVADAGGRVFKVNSAGQPVAPFRFGPVNPISSSPALAGTTLYFGSDDGNLYAIDTDTGEMRWAYQTFGPITSSPAVVTNEAQTIVVFGSNDGSLYFVKDNGAEGETLAVCPLGADFMTTGCLQEPVLRAGAAPVRSSPAIGADGTVYVGSDDGRVYAVK